jgi:acetyltransferase
VANPVDMLASADATRYRVALDAVRRDPGVDGIIAIFVSPIMIDAYEVAKAIAAAADGDKPVLSVFMGKQRSSEGRELLASSGVPVYRFPEEAASAMAAMCTYRTLRDRPSGKQRRFRYDRKAANRVIRSARRAGRCDLRHAEIRKLLEAFGFPMVPERWVTSRAEAIAAGQELGHPVVLKVVSERFSHKTDIGGVRVDLRNDSDVGAAFAEVGARLRKRDPNLKLLVQKMVRGRELLYGMVHDAQFGPLLMFGRGGIHVETLKDVTLRIHPITDVDAAEMVRRIRSFPLLAGVRGEKGVPLDFVERTLLRLSHMVGELENELEELDLNPLIVGARASDSCVVDARIRLRG